MTDKDFVKEIYQYINNTPLLMSLLYDIDFLPEQTMDTPKHNITLIIANAWRYNNKLIEGRT